MTTPGDHATTGVTVTIPAAAGAVYRAFTSPEALEAWQAPGEMTATVHGFDLRVGGGYEMTLRYPESTAGAPGKTTEREDRYSSRFVELDPPRRVVQAIRFDAADPAFGGEMTMTVSLVEVEGSTAVTISYANVPPGIRPEDNEAGSRMSLEKLAAYLARPGGVATG